jgi:quinol monooxygenase YgiN
MVDHATFAHIMETKKMSTIVLLEIQVKPEAVDEMKAFLKRILPDTRAYDGCQGIDIYGNLDKPGNLVFYERWASRQHYEKYLAWRTETWAVAQLGAMLAAPPSIRYFERVDA